VPADDEFVAVRQTTSVSPRAHLEARSEPGRNVDVVAVEAGGDGAWPIAYRFMERGQVRLHLDADVQARRSAEDDVIIGMNEFDPVGIPLRSARAPDARHEIHQIVGHIVLPNPRFTA
jgi:hypothetical protein